MKVSKVDKIVTRIKNNPIGALLITFGIIVIAIAEFSGALKNLTTTIGELVGPSAPVDISGHWEAKKTEKTGWTYFHFKIVDNKLYGTVWSGPTSSMPYGKSGILDGKIIGNRVSFTTKLEYVKQSGRYNFETKQRTPDVRAEPVTHYKGEISGDEIHFSKETGGGYYSEIIAKKIVDLTDITPASKSSEKKNVYSLAYALPGHEGGVKSLSFGPDQARYLSGGLWLMSGGLKDGKIKYWDIATAEPYGTIDLPTTKDGGLVHLAYSPKIRNIGVDLTATGVSKDGHNVSFYNSYIYISGGASSSGRKQKFSGVVGPVAISGNSYRLAIAETDGTSKFTIIICYSDGDVKRTLNCEGDVHAIALSFDGNLLSSAEAIRSNKTLLKLWDVDTGAIKWITSSQTSISHIAFSPNASMLATAGVEYGQIRIWDAITGSLKFILSDKQDNGISSITFSNSGKFLASSDFHSGIIKLWNTSTGTLDHAINNEGPVSALSFSYDDRLLAAGNSDKGNIKIWAKPKK